MTDGNVRMELMTSPEVARYLQRSDLAILPVGCFEMHGPHVPLGCDTIHAHAMSVILAALLQTFVPREWVSSLMGAGHWYGVLLAGVLGVPFYACGGGAVPLIAGLMAQGMSPGAALAFFLAGPATRLTSLAALGTLLKRRALIVYVAYIVVRAALAGLALDLMMDT